MLSLREAVESWLGAASLPERTARLDAIFTKALHFIIKCIYSDFFFFWHIVKHHRNAAR